MSPLSQTISLNPFNCVFDINLVPSSWKRCDAVVKTSKRVFVLTLVVPSQSAVIPTSKREYTKQHTYSSCLELQALSDRISQQFHAKCLIAEASTFTSPENQFYSCYRFEQHLNTSQVILGFSIVVLLMFCANEHRNLERQSRICCYVKYGWKQCLIFGEEGTPSAARMISFENYSKEIGGFHFHDGSISDRNRFRFAS